MFQLTNLTSGQQGAAEFERIISPDSPEIPACVSNSAGGLSYTSATGKNVTIQPTDSRFSVQVYDTGAGILDSNGYYIVCKYDQWFGADYPKITAQMRMNSPNAYISGDIVWCQSYATTESSPTSTDDGYLLLQPIQELQPQAVFIHVTNLTPTPSQGVITNYDLATSTWIDTSTVVQVRGINMDAPPKGRVYRGYYVGHDSGTGHDVYEVIYNSGTMNFMLQGVYSGGTTPPYGGQWYLAYPCYFDTSTGWTFYGDEITYGNYKAFIQMGQQGAQYYNSGVVIQGIPYSVDPIDGYMVVGSGAAPIANEFVEHGSLTSYWAATGGDLQSNIPAYSTRQILAGYPKVFHNGTFDLTDIYTTDFLSEWYGSGIGTVSELELYNGSPLGLYFRANRYDTSGGGAGGSIGWNFEPVEGIIRPMIRTTVNQSLPLNVTHLDISGLDDGGLFYKGAAYLELFSDIPLYGDLTSVVTTSGNYARQGMITYDAGDIYVCVAATYSGSPPITTAATWKRAPFQEKPSSVGNIPVTAGGASTTVTVTLGVTMPDTNYFVQLTPAYDTANLTSFGWNNKTTTTFDIVYYGNYNYSFDWRAAYN